MVKLYRTHYYWVEVHKSTEPPLSGIAGLWRGEIRAEILHQDLICFGFGEYAFSRPRRIPSAILFFTVLLKPQVTLTIAR